MKNERDEPVESSPVPVTSPVKTAGRERRVLSVVFTLVVGAMLAIKVDDFFCGLFGSASWGDGFIIILLPLLITLLGFIYLKCFRWRNRWAWPAAVVMALLYLFPTGFVLLPHGTSHAWGFYFWGKRNVDVPVAVRWAQRFQAPPPAGTQPTTISRYDVENYEVPYSQLPPEIQRIVPASLLKADKYDHVPIPEMGPRAIYSRKEKTLSLYYGSGMMGSWGITVGRECALRVPHYRDTIRISDDAYVFWRGE